MTNFIPTGVCSSEISFTIESGIVKNVHFIKGCRGNLEAISKLVDGLPVPDVIHKLQGITCRNGTSCADQLALALKNAYAAADEV